MNIIVYLNYGHLGHMMKDYKFLKKELKEKKFN